jgi:hypothetical protein
MAMSRLDAVFVTDQPLVAACLDADTALALHGSGWLRLAQTVGESTFFMWPAVFDAWRQVLAQGVVPRVIVVLRGAQVVGVLPLMQATVRRGPAFVPRIDYGPFDRDLSPGGMRAFAVRQVSSIVSWRALALRPALLCADADRGVVIEAVTQVLADMDGVDQIVLPVRDGEEAVWMAGFQAAGLHPWLHALQRKVLTVNQVRPFDDIVAAQSRDFRKNVRRARAHAAEVGLTYAIHVGHDAVLPQMESMAQLAAQSWKGVGGRADNTAIPYAGAQQRFFERVFGDRASGMTPVLLTGAVAGQPVIASLCMQHGQTLTGLLTFRNDQHAAASPGLMGMGCLIDYAVAQGLQAFDLNATQDWLRHIADSSHMLVNVCAFRPTLRGRVYDMIARRRRGSDAI